MKKTTLLVAALVFLSVGAFSQDADYYSGSFVRLTYVKGDVIVARAGDQGSEAGVVNMTVVEGDQIETKSGRAEVSFGRKNYLRFDNDTLVEFSNLPRSGDDRVRIHLLSGNVYLRINALEEEKSFEIHTPGASFYVLEEGLYRFDARVNGETELSVLEGSIEAAGEGGSQLVGSREMLLAANGQLGSQSSLAHGRDDFASWNEDRDAVQNRYVSKRYLPAELDDYENELADNGSWAYERPYGYVWVPNVHSYMDWRPYYYGYWDWYPLCGWTWVPYEPWGWGVYHYGRWGWRLGLGWYWIPHHAWGPAWVHWYWGHDYWGWSPLSWYNYPCVLVNNYFYDRYHGGGGRYPGGSRALTVVHRDQLQNRHISKVALSHTDASRLGDISMQAKAPDAKPVLRSSGLQRATPSLTKTLQPQVRPSSLSKSGAVAAPRSPSRLSSSALDKSRGVASGRLPSQGSRVSPVGLSQNRDVRVYPSTRRIEKPSGVKPPARIQSPDSVSSSPREIRPFESRQDRAASSSPSGIRSYSSSPRITSTDRLRSLARPSSSPRVYSPSPSVTRYGTSSGLSSSRSPERRASIFGDRSVFSRSPSSRSYSYSSPSSRSGFSSSRPYSPSSRSLLGSRSYSGSSSSRSVFSAPRSSSSSRSFGSASRSSSRPSSSPRSSSSRSSSSSRGPSGGSIRRR